MAHEFKNFMSIFMGYIDLFEIELRNERQPNFNYFSDIREVIGKAKNLIQQLTAIASQQDSNPVALNVDQEILAVMKMVRPTLVAGELKRRIEFNISIEQNLPAICFDQGQFGLILINLLFNARDAIVENNSDGKIILEAKKVKIKNTDLNGRKGDFVCLTVTDDGVGIKKEHISKIFEPFFSTKATEGTGLGLSMVYGFLRQQKGWIEVQSEFQHGTTFLLYFPLYQSSS
jgi:two-component system cell cycle sensor histidine kinase/response regulator CckA